MTMLKRMTALLLLGLLTMTGALAQAGEDTVYPRQSVPVANVEIIDTLDAVTLRIAGTLSDSCDDLMWTWAWSNDVLFIDLYREVRPEVACAAVETPYEFVVPVETIIQEYFADPAQFVLVVNDFMLRVDWQAIGSAPDDLPYNLQLSKGTVRVDSVARTADGIRLTGEMGCGYLVARLVKAWTQPEASLYRVEAYLAIDPAMMCIAGFVPFDVMLPSDAPDGALYNVNGFMLPTEFGSEAAGQSYSIMEMPITDVTSVVQESFPPQLALTVSGTTDGCDYPVQLVFEPLQEGYSIITVRVARVAPVGIACPAVAVDFTASGSLTVPTPGEYILIVNGEERGRVGL
jgi:hypothetical protein